MDEAYRLGTNHSSWVGGGGGPAPKQFLELNKPVQGVDGKQWLVGLKKLQGK